MTAHGVLSVLSAWSDPAKASKIIKSHLMRSAVPRSAPIHAHKMSLRVCVCVCVCVCVKERERDIYTHAHTCLYAVHRKRPCVST